MKTWEEAKVMELNINETATDATESASYGWGWGRPQQPQKDPSYGGNASCTDKGFNVDSDSSVVDPADSLS